MVKPKDILTRCIGFEWDDGNLTKNWKKHDVTDGECEQIFFNQPLIVKREKKHSPLENRYYVLGRTDTERLLFMVFTVRKDKIRLISARDMTRAEQKRYRK
ncbi:MAG: BrnT family toxin [PVC group bacterium]